MYHKCNGGYTNVLTDGTDNFGKSATKSSTMTGIQRHSRRDILENEVRFSLHEGVQQIQIRSSFSRVLYCIIWPLSGHFRVMVNPSSTFLQFYRLALPR
ncbi:unnamed protein product [Absidia cylindrospora]